MTTRHLRSQPALAALVSVSIGAAFAGWAASAHAEPWVFKHDQFDADLTAAAAQVNGGQFYTQPGFVAGEAFGQIYAPLPEMFPLIVTGFDIILAAPPNAASAVFANATIEIYSSDAVGADPASSPIFSISTADLFNPQTQNFGFPLQGNVGIHVDFGQGAPEDRPPTIDGGKIWLVIRFNDAAQDLSTEWGTLSCMKLSTPELGDLACGCQNVGTVHDSAIVKKVNVIHHVTPIGQCSGSKTWSFMENIPALSSGFTINGDVIMRLHAAVAAAPCVGDCEGRQCGDDGCGESCGSCTNGLACDDGQCVSCVPNCLSKQCGDNGCGGVCGTCDNGETCGNDFFCHAACVPNCNGKECGPNGCGGTCGACESDESCQAGQCVATCTPSCLGKECGDNGCGQSCGNCEGHETCVDSQCVDPACEPVCDGLECGADGCGGSCGSCENDAPCVAGKCQGAPPPLLAVGGISPDRAFVQTQTPVSITGQGFKAGVIVKVGAATCTDVSLTGAGLISAVVPGLPAGTYDVIVANADGAVATLEDGFAVVLATGQSSDGCGGAPLSTTALVAFALVVRLCKRRRAC